MIDCDECKGSKPEINFILFNCKHLVCSSCCIKKYKSHKKEFTENKINISHDNFLCFVSGCLSTLDLKTFNEIRLIANEKEIL